MNTPKARSHFRALEYDNNHVCVGDGTLGWKEHAPYDGIVVTAGGPEIPDPLLEQLKTDGYLVIPIGDWKSTQKLVRVHRAHQKDYQEEDLGSVRFVPLVGEAGWQQG
jgi:protein-L-isoaspartate(D-aspartate) O-methyltransferase